MHPAKNFQKFVPGEQVMGGPLNLHVRHSCSDETFCADPMHMH